MYINELKKVIVKYRYSIKGVSEAIGKTPNWFHKAVKHDTFQVKDLLAMCAYMNIPLSEIFKGEIKEYKTIREDEIQTINEPLNKYEMKNDQLILSELKRINQRIDKMESEIGDLKQRAE